MTFADDQKLQVNVAERQFKKMRSYRAAGVPRFVMLEDLKKVYDQFKATPYWQEQREQITQRPS